MTPESQLQLAGAPALRAASLRVALLCLAAAAICLILPFLPLEHLFLYVVVLCMAGCWLVPLWGAWNRGQLDWFAPVHVLGAIYFVYFGLGSIIAVHDPRAVYDLYVPPHVPRAALYCLVGYLAALAAYYVPWRAPAVARYRERPVGVGLLLALGFVGLVGYLARASLQHFSGTRLEGFHLTSVFSPLFMMASVMAWYLFFAKQMTRAQRWVLFGLLVPGTLLVIFLTVGNKSLSMTLLGLPLIARWYVHRRMPWKTLGLLLLITVFVIFPLYNTYRLFEQADHTDRMAKSYETVTSWSGGAYLDRAVSQFTSRLAIINSVAIVVRDVGIWQPFARGETIFEPMATAFIPRALWPNKPLPKGTEFGRRFRITNWFSRYVHIAPSWPGDLYWNFGVSGILIGLAIAGGTLRWLYRRYMERMSGPVPLAIWVMLLSQSAVLIEAAVMPTVVETVRLVLIVEAVRLIARNYGFIEREPVAS